MFEKITVLCPICSTTRQINKSSFKGNLGSEPYIQECRKCTNKQRTQTAESKAAISAALSNRSLSEQTKKKISDYMKAHPELWLTLQPELGPISRIDTHHSDESKKKISKGVKQSKKGENQ